MTTSDSCPAMLWPPLRVRSLYGTLYFSIQPYRYSTRAAATIDLAKGRSWLGAVKLHDKNCKEHGGRNFATNWILATLKYRVSDVLRHTFTTQRAAAMNFTGGFEPYDGFVMKVEACAGFILVWPMYVNSGT